LTRNLKDLPKIELHVHLEGCVSPAEASTLAFRKGMKHDPEEIRKLYRHASFQDFLSHFGQLVDLLSEPDDLLWLFERELLRLKRQGVVYAEIRVSPTVWERHGLPPESCLRRLAERTSSAPIACRLIVDGVRQWDRAMLERDLDLALALRNKGVVAFGLGGDEASAPACVFRDLAGACREVGFPIIPHAGEALGPEEVKSALEVFSPPRLGHGIAAARDPRVLEEVVARRVHLEVCPTSNRKTGAVGRREEHPLKALWTAGSHLSLGTDDPALFGTTLCRELSWALRRGGWTMKDVAASQALAAQASLLPERQKRDLLQKVS
jgi:adenosine deaminase